MTGRTLGDLALAAALAVWVGRYAWRAAQEMPSRGPEERAGVMRLAPSAPAPPPGLGAPVTLADGAAGVLLERAPHAVRIWDPVNGERVIFSDDPARHLRRAPPAGRGAGAPAR